VRLLEEYKPGRNLYTNVRSRSTSEPKTAGGYRWATGNLVRDANGGRTMRRSKVTNEDELRWAEHSHGEKFGYKRKYLSSAAGGEKLGCSLYEVPPGRRAWPYHYHGANEEAIYVLEGSGTLRVGEEKVPLSKGDYAVFPAGAEEGAHQLVNTSDEPLRYLCFSTMIEPDAIVYPDSSKIGVVVGAAPGGPKEKRTLSGLFRQEDGVDYYEGEG